MDDITYVRLQLLEILYGYLGEFLAWSQLYESAQMGLGFPSPRLVIPSLQFIIRGVEANLGRVLGPDHNFREVCVRSGHQRFLILRLLIDRARFNCNH